MSQISDRWRQQTPPSASVRLILCRNILKFWSSKSSCVTLSWVFCCTATVKLNPSRILTAIVILSSSGEGLNEPETLEAERGLPERPPPTVCRKANRLRWRGETASRRGTGRRSSGRKTPDLWGEEPNPLQVKRSNKNIHGMSSCLTRPGYIHTADKRGWKYAVSVQFSSFHPKNSDLCHFHIWLWFGYISNCFQSTCSLNYHVAVY